MRAAPFGARVRGCGTSRSEALAQCRWASSFVWRTALGRMYRAFIPPPIARASVPNSSTRIGWPPSLTTLSRPNLRGPPDAIVQKQREDPHIMGFRGGCSDTPRRTDDHRVTGIGDSLPAGRPTGAGDWRGVGRRCSNTWKAVVS
jgi:hypothetical protein